MKKESIKTTAATWLCRKPVFRSCLHFTLFFIFSLAIPFSKSYSNNGLNTEIIQKQLIDTLIKGKVTSSKGDPLAGASVTVSNRRSVLTNNQGEFTLNAPLNGVLTVSYVGYISRQVALAGRTYVEIQLEMDTVSLTGVVVIGYTTQKKKDLTGSVAVINAKDIKDIPVGGIDQIMQGKAAGVSVTQNTGAPGDGVTVRIRGVGTINDNNPLYIVDGIPTKDGINQLSPNDIESISVLKDASSASIYGARASNGVVIITTKKGKTGKPAVSLNMYTGWQSPEKYVKMANTRQYITAYNTAAANDGRAQIPLGMLDTLPDVNWQKEVLKTAPMSNAQLSLSGGSESTKYLVSASYFSQDGMIINSDYKRFNLRTSIDSRINKMFRVGTNLNLAYNRTKQVGSSGDGYSQGAGANNPGPSVLRYALFRTPATPVYDKSGNYVDIPNPPGFFGDGLNPVGLANNTDRKYYGYSLLGDIYLELTPIDHLKIKSDFGSNLVITDYREFFPTWGSPARLQNSPNALRQSNRNAYNYNWTNTAIYDWLFDKHTFNFLAGTEIVYNGTKLISASNTNFPNQAPEFQYLNLGTGLTPSVGGDAASASLSSVFGRIDYQYDNRYIAAFNVRRDGSSRLDPDNRWGNFYSGSVGWRISNEKFMEDVKFISNLKLRASMGQLGNQEINFYNYATLVGNYGYYPFGNTAVPAYTIYQKGNPKVKWETSTITDIGLDLGLFKGALSITADYYRRITTNLLVNPPDPTSAGSVAAAAFINNGKILNRGFDFEVAYQHNGSKDWNYGVSANLSTTHNEVLALFNNSPIPAGRVDNNVFVTSTAVGHPIGSFYLLQQEGIFQNALDVFTHASQGNNIRPGDVKFKDVNKDGVIDQNDRVYAGSAIPTITYGFTGNVGYKAFDMSLFFQGVGGNKIYSQINTDIEGFYRPFNITERIATQSWHGEGTSNEFPRLSWAGAQNNKITSTRFLENGSYLRLKNVQLGYTLPSEAINRLKISSLRLFVSAQNVFTITKFTGLDPEMTISANSSGDGVKAVGIDWGTYPSARTLTIGVNVNL